ncbi:DEAD/DEAH box helicase, partial [Paraburkholderia sp. BR14261]
MSNVPKRPASAQGSNTPAGKETAQDGAKAKGAAQKYGDGQKLASTDKLAALMGGGALGGARVQDKRAEQKQPQAQQQTPPRAEQRPDQQPDQELHQQPEQGNETKPAPQSPSQSPSRGEPRAQRSAAQPARRREARDDRRPAQRNEPRDRPNESREARAEAPRNQPSRAQQPPPKQAKPQNPPNPQRSAKPKSEHAPRPGSEGERDRAPRAERQERPPRAPRAHIEPNKVPPITFPEALPVSGRREEIARAIAQNQVVIVSGETGSGKTTQLPKIALALGRGLGAGGTGLIGHTQPRRIAASATARRIADELNTPFGEVVGYKVRFTDNLSPGASVKLMTDGILLAETQTDPLLKAYDTIIIDEAHERSLNIDFLLGYLKEILPRRPDLKLIVTSATIDADRFARHFGSEEKPAPVIEVSGRLYPVEVRYRPVQE